ncbi:MAG TPA: hypothetical protein VGH24_07435 [Solirubrobacteraceae bacterium]
MALPDPSPGGAYPSGYLAEHPLPSGIVGSLGLGGYQLLADLAGVGAGRLGSQAFLLVVPDRDPSVPDLGTQISLHHRRLKDDAEAAAFMQLAAQLAYLRLTGYRLAPERRGLRSRISVVNPATGGVAVTIPEKHAGMLGGTSASKLLVSVRGLPPAGPPPDLQNSELMRQVLLSLALQDADVSGAEAAELADRALELSQGHRALDPPAALEAAKQSSG